MSAAPEPAEPAGAPGPVESAGAVTEAEDDARELFLAQARAELPPYLDFDDAGNVVPAEGFQMCPACKGTTVIPEAAPLSPLYAPCPHCQGWGRVSTGSRLSETANVTCESCNGNGYVRKDTWLASHPEDAGLFGDIENGR